MFTFSGSVFIDLLSFAASVLAVILALFSWQHGTWKRKGIPFEEPIFFFGNMTPPWKGRHNLAEEAMRWYREAKEKGLRYYGNYIMPTPVLTIVDAELVKRVLMKDFQYFPDHGFYMNERDDPLSAHLLSMEGEKWKNLRTKLAPAFTSSKVRMMFQSVVDQTIPMIAFLKDKCERMEPANMKEVFASFTIDVIGSCGFGIECNSFKQMDNPFYDCGRKVIETTRSEEITRMLAFAIPEMAKLLRIRVNKPEVQHFFMKLVKDTVQQREENDTRRNDFMQLLIELKQSSPADDPFTINQLAAQAFIFFLGGFETSSTAGTFCLYELSMNQELQQKVRKEINEVLKKHDGQITYESVQEMKYMGQVIDETLRKYPPLPVLNRICAQDYKVPDSDTVIEKGTRLVIPILALHHDSEHFPDPEKFDPDRFSEENKKNITTCTYIPFGEGPRICIGMRFGLVQFRVGLAVLLKNFKFSLNPKTEVPIKMDPKSFTLFPLGGVWVNIEPAE